MITMDDLFAAEEEFINVMIRHGGSYDLEDDDQGPYRVALAAAGFDADPDEFDLWSYGTAIMIIAREAGEELLAGSPGSVPEFAEKIVAGVAMVPGEHMLRIVTTAITMGMIVGGMAVRNELRED